MTAPKVVDVDVLVEALRVRAEAVPLGETYHGGPLDGAPVYNVYKAAIALIRNVIAAESDAAAMS